MTDPKPGARWLVQPGMRPDLAAVDTRATDGAPGGKHDTKAATDALDEELFGLQDRLWAENERALLLVLQGLDASGKDGVVKNVFKGVNPQGVTVKSFKEPTEEELGHDFLWRVHRVVPARGQIGIFNRSHYEDVLVVRVEGLMPEPAWRARYRMIRDFEHLLVGEGTTIVKIHLVVSREEQAERFRKRLEDPEKQWKFATSDLRARQRWDEYREAYEEMIAETGTAESPWHVVPADRKWYRDWATQTILLETLRAMDPRYPEPREDLSGVTID